MHSNQRSQVNMIFNALKILEITSEGMMEVDFPCHDALNDMFNQVIVLLNSSKTLFTALANQCGKESPCDAGNLTALSNQLDSAMEHFRKTADEHGYSLTEC